MFRTAFLSLCILAAASGFQVAPTSGRSSSTQLSSSRRDFFAKALAVGAAALVAPQEAQATYSAYTHREEDWTSRQKSGDIQYSNARALRKQLKEIVPQNNEASSKVFCPNGPSSAVSPLMENKCSDILTAIPSVYGRTEDVAGNSIPGFNGGRYVSGGGGSASLASNPIVGGFPAYNK